ncbi:MAG: NAD(P)H-dependent glycerol-3-phosphate dehydrogenase [Spirochaetia bacterium]
MERVGILNAGAWGTAIALKLAEKGYPVTVWEPIEEVRKDINHRKRNTRYLMGVSLPENITAVEDIGEAASADMLLVATPSLYLLDTIKRILTEESIMEGRTDIGILTKGFLPTAEGTKLIAETLENYLPGFYKGNLVYISGPSHAEEVARGKITGLISACSNGRKAIRFRELLASENLLVFSSLDIIGVQVCGAVKNVIAIAFGMLEALMELIEGLGDNTESLLLAAGLNEIMTIGRAMGSTHPETFTSIAGVGDLDVTCRSRYGRNRRFGREIILDRINERFGNLDDLLGDIGSIGYLPEGAAALKHVQNIAREYKLKLPICNAVYRILNRETPPGAAFQLLLTELRGIAAAE